MLKRTASLETRDEVKRHRRSRDVRIGRLGTQLNSILSLGTPICARPSKTIPVYCNEMEDTGNNKNIIHRVGSRKQRLL